MSKKIQLSIAEPCHENWEGMSPVEKGKFCGSCHKQVVDFSNMSDRQVAEFFKKPSTGSVCGRFMSDQLERDIEIPGKRIPWVKYFFQIAIPAFLFSIKGSAQKTEANSKINVVTTDTTRKAVSKDLRVLGMVSRPIVIKPLIGDTILLPEVVVPSFSRSELIGKVVDSYSMFPKVSADRTDLKPQKITGKIVDDKNEPVPFASILIKGTKKGVIANVKGEYSITPESGWEKLVLVHSAIGFASNEIIVDRKNYSENITTIIETSKLNYEMMGEIIITKCYPKKLVKQIPIIPRIAETTKANSFKIFPNPVSSGSSLNIEWKQTEEGYYTLQLLTRSGQSFYQQEIWIDSKARFLNLKMPTVSAGNYFITLANKKTGKKFTEKIIIQ